MSHDERIARLTELAQKVWPTVGEVGWSDLVPGELMLAAYEPEWTPLLTLQCNHPRALDALEAALLVLAGEQSSMVAAHGHCFDAVGEQAARANLAEAKLERVWAWHERFGLPQNGGDELEAILDDQEG